MFPPGDAYKYADEKLVALRKETEQRRLVLSVRNRQDAAEDWSPETRRAVRRTEVIYNTVQALFWVAVGLPLPLIVVFMQARGMDLFQIGLLTSVFALTVAVLELPTGGLADAIGRKRVTLLAYGCLLIKDLVLLLAFSFPLFAAARLLGGVGRALASGALDAWYIDRLQEADPKVDIQPFLARAGTVSLFAIAVSTLLGGLIALLFSGLPEEGGAVFTPIAMTLVAAMLVQVVNLVVVTLFVKEDRAAAEARKGWGFRQVPSIIREAVTLSVTNPVLLLLLIGTAAGGFALAGVETFWQPRFAGLLGGSEGNRVLFGALMTGGFLAGMVGNLVAIPLTRFLGKRYALVGAIFRGLGGALLILLASQSTVVGATAMFWLFYFGRGVSSSPLGKVKNDEIPQARRSSMLSVSSLVSYMGFFGGSALLGLVAERASISLAWAVSGALLVVSSILYLRIDAIQRHRRMRVDREALT